MKILLLGLAVAFPPGAGVADSANSAALVTAGAYHGCSARSGQLVCWGSNSAGELGNGSTKDSLKPVAVKNISGPVAEISASYDRTCAIVGGNVYCWGRYSKVSSGKWVASPLPVKVSAIPSGAHGLSVGVKHACVLDSAGKPWCWGLNENGQLGDGTTNIRTKALKTKFAPSAEVEASDGYTLVLLASGGVQGIGISHGGDNGDPLNPPGQVVNSKTTPKMITGLSAAVAISATGDFAVALLAGGTVKAWGENDHGQLGDGTRAGKSTPLVVAGLAPSGQVVATANHVCSLNSTDGRVVCWGRGDHGQMGDGTTSDRLIPGPSAAIDVPVATLYGAASGHWTVAITDSGVYAWGRNQNGGLLDGTTNDQAKPVKVPLT
jgi:alpha-tubulin suppressor-like RCC1 family protein